jgi:uncharacterized membrane protein
VLGVADIVKRALVTVALTKSIFQIVHSTYKSIPASYIRMSSAKQHATSGIGIITILAAIVAAGVLMVFGHNTAGQIAFLVGF